MQEELLFCFAGRWLQVHQMGTCGLSRIELSKFQPISPTRVDVQTAKIHGNDTQSITTPGSTARMAKVCLPAVSCGKGIRVRL
jgi:hypothetical protein